MIFFLSKKEEPKQKHKSKIQVNKLFTSERYKNLRNTIKTTYVQATRKRFKTTSTNVQKSVQKNILAEQ